MTGRADVTPDIVVRRFRARSGHRLGSEPRHLVGALFLFNTIYSGRTGLPARTIGSPGSVPRAARSLYFCVDANSSSRAV